MTGKKAIKRKSIIMKKKHLLSLLLLVGSITMTSCSEAEINTVIDTALSNNVVQEILQEKAGATITVKTDDLDITVELPSTVEEIIESTEQEKEPEQQVAEETEQQTKPISYGGGVSSSVPKENQTDSEESLEKIEDVQEEQLELEHTENEGIESIKGTLEELNEEIKKVLEKLGDLEDELGETINKLEQFYKTEETQEITETKEEAVEPEKEPEEEIQEVKELSEIETFSLNLANQAIEVAELLVQDCDTETEQYLALMPYANMDTYLEMKELVNNITKDCTTESEKCLAIYKWVTENMTIENSAIGYSVEQAFKEHKGVCNQYTQVLHDLLSAAGIQSFYISGVRGGMKTGHVNVIDTPEQYSVETVWEDWNIEYAINYQEDVGHLNHAFLLAKTDGEWKYYDAMCPWTEDHPWFAMDVDALLKSAKVPYMVEGIKCLPDNLDLSLLHNQAVVYHNGEIFKVENNQRVSTCDSSLIYNGVLSFHRVIDPNRVYYNLGDDDLVFESSSICDYIKYYSLSARNGKTRIDILGLDSQLAFYTSTGLRKPIVEGLEYLSAKYSVDAINEMLLGTPLSVDNTSLYYSDVIETIKISDLNLVSMFD